MARIFSQVYLSAGSVNLRYIYERSYIGSWESAPAERGAIYINIIPSQDLTTCRNVAESRERGGSGGPSQAVTPPPEPPGASCVIFITQSEAFPLVTAVIN